jgi:hypothetical protein
VRKIFGRRAAAPFEREAAGRGGPEGWTPRGRSVGEIEGERGGLVRLGAVRRHGSGAAAASAGGPLPRDNGEWRGRRHASRCG